MQTSSTYFDLNGLQALKNKAGQDSKQALEPVARQFESMMLDIMLKSMRASVVENEDGIGSSEATHFYRDMYDHQLALHLSENGGIGIADMLIQNLQKTLPGAKTDTNKTEVQIGQPLGQALDRLALRIDKTIDAEQIPQRFLTPDVSKEVTQNEMLSSISTQSATPVAVQLAEQPQAVPMHDIQSAQIGWTSPQEYIQQAWPFAKKAAAVIGVDAKVVMAQSVLETGWGMHTPNKAGGENSFNLFGIKTGSNWHGEKVQHKTLEFEQGVMQQRSESFRVYNSIEQAFEDYKNLITSSSRYQDALGLGENTRAYAEQLQKAGYATDPQYADKIQNIVDSDRFRELVSQAVAVNETGVA